MNIVPKTRGFICTTAHPTGCGENVSGMIKYTPENKFASRVTAISVGHLTVVS